MALFGEDADDLAVFDDFVSRVNATGLSALAMISGAAGQRLGPAAKAKGLIGAGNALWMVRSGRLPDQRASEFFTRRATEAHEMSLFADLAASAFAMDRAWVDRTFAAPSLLDAPALGFYVAYRGDGPMSGVCTSGAGSTAGIWTMGPPPEKQRQGAGRGGRVAAMQNHLRRGA